MRRSKLVVVVGLVAIAVIAVAAGAVGSTARAALTDNNFQCSGNTIENDALAQNCEVTDASGTCYERSTSPVVVQTCTFTQASAGDRHANATQIIASQDAAPLVGGGDRQDGTQTVNVNQAGGASNFVTVSQSINQKLGPGTLDDTEENELEPAGDPPSPTPIVQSQESHQYVFVTQSGSTGNSSNISQFLKQRERAAHAPSITQHQNLEDRGGCAADDPNANMCAIVNQNGTGKSVSALSEDYREFQRALDTPAGEQVQGNVQPFKGGENHQINQSTPTPDSISTNQSERQTQRAVHTGTLTQAQNGPRKGFGSTQESSLDSTWKGSMVSTQTQTNRPNAADVGTSSYAAAGTQLNDLEYYGTSTGDIRASLTANERSNGQNVSVQNSCPADLTSTVANHECAAVIVCGNVSESFAPTSEGGPCAADSCPPGEVFDPTTRACVPTDFAIRK